MTRLPQLERSLYDAVARSERASATGGRRRSDRPARPRRMRITILAAACTLGVGGAALAATGILSAGPVSLQQYRAGQRATLADTIPASQRAAFAVLRRPAAAADALPPGLMPSMFKGVYGANGALARRAPRLPGGISAWAVPGARALCLIASGGAAGGPDKYVLKAGVSIESGGVGRPEAIVGLVPDGVSSVTLTLGDRRKQTIRVEDDFYSATVTGGIIGVTKNHGRAADDRPRVPVRRPSDP
jgi:hypothetical protein